MLSVYGNKLRRLVSDRASRDGAKRRAKKSFVARSGLGRFAAFGPPTRTLEAGLKRGSAKGPGTGLRALFQTMSTGYLHAEAWQRPSKQAFVPP